MKGIIKKDNKYQTCCNKCGRGLRQEKGIFVEDFFEAKKSWGYFSKKDLEQHSFRLCEDCYDELVGGFAIPLEISDRTEAL